jgi:hypothetical protein
MPSPTNISNITPPRVDLIDPRTGLISREWYRFFLNLFQLTGSGQNTTSLTDLQLGPPAPQQEDLTSVIVDVSGLEKQPSQESALDQIAELEKQIEALELQPVIDDGAINAAIAALSTAPVTKTANFTVANGETWLINNKSGSSCTVTLPTASTNTGRVLHFQNYQAQTLVSASSNVVPLAGGSATTAILEAVAGANATLVSDGTNWIMTQYDSNNALQLE